MGTLAKLLKALNSESEPGQISLAFVLGMFIGLTPLMTPHNLVILLLALMLRVNLSGFFLAWAAFSGIAYLFDPLFGLTGEYLLTHSALQAFWTELYNSTAWRLTQFNNTIVAGSMALSLGLAIPLFFISQILIKNYRQRLQAWIEKTRIGQFIKASKLYKIYAALSESESAL